MSIKGIVQSLQKDLDEKDEVREDVLSNSRAAIRLSKQAVMAAHRGELSEAEEMLGQALRLLNHIRDRSSKHREFFYHGAVTAAFQEYAEARTFYELVKEGDFLDPRDFGIPIVPYLLGLADVIGELRRRALDHLRAGDLRGSEKCLRIMEDIYSELISLRSVYNLAPSLRKKCDIARRLIEATRRDITVETRMSVLRMSLEGLEKRVPEEVARKPRKVEGSHVEGSVASAGDG